MPVVIREVSIRKMEVSRVAKLGKTYVSSDGLTQYPVVDETLVTCPEDGNMKCGNKYCHGLLH